MSGTASHDSHRPSHVAGFLSLGDNIYREKKALFTSCMSPALHPCFGSVVTVSKSKLWSCVNVATYSPAGSGQDEG